MISLENRTRMIQIKLIFTDTLKEKSVVDPSRQFNPCSIGLEMVAR